MAALGVAALAGAAVLTAQTAEPQQPTFRTEANFVRVDVYPTQDGRLVRDLGPDDFAIFEDGTPQRIETFELVEVPTGPAVTTARRPSTVQESRELLAEARARVVVLFLDTYHITDESAQNIGEPLAEMLRRSLGPGDLVAVMTPQMRPEDLTFETSSVTIERLLAEKRNWGRRGELGIGDLDPVEVGYRACYPPGSTGPISDDLQIEGGNLSEVAWEMIQRRRENLTLRALDDLVQYVGALRDERKAVLTVSEGWRLFRPNDRLAGMVDRRVPGLPGARIGAGGTIESAGDRGSETTSRYKCDADRMDLAFLDHPRDFRELWQRANRTNVSFYTVDPRGLAVWDSTLTEPPVPTAIDRAQLRTRQENLKVLAEQTDGLALVDRGDLESQLGRILDDLSAYYLLGYYSTNPDLDGGYREIRVRVARPGVEVRARRGYRAPTREEVEAARTAAAAPAGATASEGASAVQDALATLSALDSAPDAVRLAAAEGWVGGPSSAQPAVWVIGELNPRLAQSADWRSGARAVLLLVDGAGRTRASASATIPPGARSFLAQLSPGEVGDGELTVQVRLSPAAGGASPLLGTASVRWESPTDLVRGEPMLSRAAAAQAASFASTADARFRRTERLEARLLVGPGVTGEARLLDRQGSELQVPVRAAAIDEADGRWATAEVLLAALAPGDYLLALDLSGPAGRTRQLVAFRVVP